MLQWPTIKLVVLCFCSLPAALLAMTAWIDCNGVYYSCSLDDCDMSSPFVPILKDVTSRGVASIRGIEPVDVQNLHKSLGAKEPADVLFARVLLIANMCHWSASNMEVGTAHLLLLLNGDTFPACSHA